MTCDDYLSMLATSPVDELARGRAREHADSCRECDRVTRVVAERERNMYLALGDLYPSASAGEIAARALAMSRRRTVALYYRIGLGVATAATILFFTVARGTPVASSSANLSETFHLQCLSPEQAAEVLRPSLGTTARVTIQPQSPLGIIKVETSPEEMERVRSALERYDSAAESQCAVQVTVPDVIIKVR